MVDDRVSLLPEDLAKQVGACRGVQSGLRAYEGELASLRTQGRVLETDATDEERAETLARLEDLQRLFNTAIQKVTQRVQDLEKALTSRKYFQVDLNKTCHWLRQAEVVTFPEVSVTDKDGDVELQAQLSKFQNVLEQALEYENLLLIVHRVGQEILPSLNEVDHCYLDEKLNALPQQYNSILALAKEKKDRLQHAISERKEFDTFFDITQNALEELQEQFDTLGKQRISFRGEDVDRLCQEHKDLAESLSHLSPDVRELRGKTEGFLSRGLRCRPEETQSLVNLHDSLKRLIDGSVNHLGESSKTLGEHNATSAQLDCGLRSVQEEDRKSVV